MKLVRFDVFEYIVDEIWNIPTNPLISYGFAPYIQFMIESVAQEKFYKDVRHDPLPQQCLGVTEPPQKWGVCLPRSYRGILDEARMRKHTQISIQDQIW
jgi:hypothetical protein